MKRGVVCALLLSSAVAACVPARGPVQTNVAPLPPVPTVEPARAINLLYEHNFAATIARRLASACAEISVNEGAISNGEAQVRGVVAASGLSEDDVRARLDAVSQTRLAGDVDAFTNQTGIRFSDPESNCSVARGQIAGGSRIGAYLSDLPGLAYSSNAPEAIAADALTAIGGTGTGALSSPETAGTGAGGLASPDSGIGLGAQGLSGGISNEPLPPADSGTDG
ncbi:MAG: DUF5333 family protein [Pseudomonadota bacterium]